MDLNLNKLAANKLCSWYFNKKSKKSNDTKELRSDDLKIRRKQYGICLKCGKTLTDYKYCQSCSSKEFKLKFGEWTSENQYIDEFIQNSQLNATNDKSYLLWIPYDDLIDVKYLANGGFTSVYSAIWDRFVTGHLVDVVLKRLHHGQISNPEFLRDQVSIFLYGAVKNSNIVRCYGFTKHPTEGYMLVLEYAQDGDLRSFLRQQTSTLLWSDKLLILREISKSLELLHNYEIFHGDLHTGNVLKKHIRTKKNSKSKKNSSNIREIILDMPLNFDSDVSAASSYPYGVIPYVGPEVFEKGYYTKQSDIYSLGIIMWELSTDQTPFFEYTSDKKLVDDILNGVRPEIDDDQQIPKCVVDLIQRCWDPKPFNRPSAKTITSIINEWILILSTSKIRLSDKSKKVFDQFSSANNTTKKKVKRQRQSTYPTSLSRASTILRNNNYYSKSLSKYITRIDVEKSANASSFSSTESVNTVIQQDYYL